MEASYAKYVSDRIQLLLETSDLAIYTETVRSEQAEDRLVRLRDTLMIVRKQHEKIQQNYEELRQKYESLQKKQELTRQISQPFQTLSQDYENSRDVNVTDSVVKRMRAQLEENARRAGVTPVAKRTKPNVNLAKSFA